MDVDSEVSRAERRLAMLRSEIATAEATLRELDAAIFAARSDAGLRAAHNVQEENERLHVENLAAVREVESAHAALDVAVKASQTDALTGLLNRGVLWDRLSHDLATARRHGTCVAIYFLDLDGFKRVNDEHGHAVGDLLLQRVAQVLTGTVRASDTVFRMGGDEFIVLAAANRVADVGQVAAKIAAALAEPFVLAGVPMRVTASVGVSIFPDDGESPGVLVRKADEAMYRVKRSAHSWR